MSLYASGVVRIISEPQLKSFDSGNVVVNFAAGINEGKDKDGSYINNAIDVEIWGKSAEIVYDKLKTGDSLFVTGNVRRNEWTDRETGDKRSKHSLSVARFEFLPRPASSEVAF